MSFTRNLQNYLQQNNHYKSFQNNDWSNSIENYEFLEQIGSGSFGRVFMAKCNNKKECAVKCISKIKSPNTSKILSEVSIHIRLSHPNILQLFTVLEDVKNVYLVMEMCHGGSLSQLINNEVNKRKLNPQINVKSYPLKPVLSYELASIIITQICNGLSYLHRHSIVHRDLNLNNILLVKPFDYRKFTYDLFNSEYFQIKLADFGLAIDLNSKQENKSCLNNMAIGTTICGTPGFISPEIWTQMSTVSYKSDIFSLGSILFSCIAGYTPKGDIDLSAFLPMTADLITRLLNQNPDDRPDIEDIMNHIFICGRINSQRLHPIEKTTKTLKMSIDKSGKVQLKFLKNNLSIGTSGNGSQVLISYKFNTANYDFYELPEKYWKKYLYLVRFVKLVKGKSAKITVHCSDWFKERTDDKEYITKCVLMEDGTFEVTLLNEILDETFKFVVGDSSTLPSNLNKFQPKIKTLYDKICKIEMELNSISSEIQLNLFPIMLGINKKLYDQVNEESPIKNTSFISSQILRSIQINGIGHATQFSNGSIKVNFTDGSHLCFDNESQIFYVENGILKKFSKEDLLPETVLNKISRLPQVINHLRKGDGISNEKVYLEKPRNSEYNFHSESDSI